jgi:hypothetical protein
MSKTNPRFYLIVKKFTIIIVWVLHFSPWIYTKGLSIFTVRLIVAISLCSILLHNLITNRESLLLSYKFNYVKYSVN